MSNCHLKGLAWPPLDPDGPGEPTHFNLSSQKIRKNEASSPTLFHVFLVGGIPTPLKNDGVHQLG